MGRSKGHSLKATNTNWCGINISGYAEDGEILIEPVGDVGEITEGADGEYSIFSHYHGDNYIATISLTEYARAVLWMDLKVQEIRVASGIGPEIPRPFSYFNPKSGERISCDLALPMKLPNRGAAKKTGVREYKLALLNCNVQAPALNLI